MTTPQIESGQFSDVIPGVVDGTVTATLDAEGNVSLHVLVGRHGRNSERCDHIEFILTEENARQLGAMLTTATATAARTGPVPCSVGVRLNSPFSGTEADLASAGPSAR
ncbi:hypothetical protein [Kitasatospora sp. NPDC050463]|uniref:hypothetical protein n=1 Tax=Kitasatospora sp. NPDC050463 TaxID=3155786 RepID=UPI0033DB62F3